MYGAGPVEAGLRTTHIPWLPRSQWPQTLARYVARLFPSIRYANSLPTLDGPLAEKRPSVVELHGKPQKPDYFGYMEDLNDRNTLKYVRREQSHWKMLNNKMLLQAGKFRVWGELDARCVVSTRDGGFDKGEERIGDYIYFTRALAQESTEVGFYRKKLGETDLLSEELINPFELKQQFGYQFCNIGICRVSENGKMLAYTLSVEGGDKYICHVRTVDSGAIFHAIRSSNIVSIEFGSANNFFYTECNELNRPYRVMMQELRPGLLPPPVEVYRDEDEGFFVDVRKTKDGRFLVFSSDSKTSGNVLLLPASFPVISKELKPFFAEGKPLEVAGKEAWGWLEHHAHHFIMVTSQDAPNFKVVFAREEVVLRDKRNTSWQELIPHDPNVQITDVDIFKTHFVAFETTFGFEKASQLRVIGIEDGVEKAVDRSGDAIVHFPALSFLTPGLNRNFDQDTINFTYSNIVTPARECVYQLNNNLSKQEMRLMSPHNLYTVRQHEAFTPWDYMWDYHAFRDVVTSGDGTDIPITIFQKRDLFVEEITDADPIANSPRHCLLYVYGSYGEIPAMHFQLAPYLWLIRRRWVVAFAHVRGGGDLPGWADAGKGKNKINAVRDFIACCEWLVRQGYTTPRHLIVAGNSAGAVPIAAAANMKGNSLFEMALLRAPFVDIINTMRDTTLPLSLAEREDWGDPLNNEEDLRLLKQYDPYHNINDRVTYPSMIVSTCLDDDRVPAWNALKYVAALRQQRASKPHVDPIANPIILRVKNNGGHYHWNETLAISEEIALLCHMFDIPGPGQRYDDLDAMHQMHNYFSIGLMDHDDQTQTFLKWEAWERERIDYISRLNRMSHEPNFRVLLAKKDPYYWSHVPKDEPILQAPPGEPEVKDPYAQLSRKANVFISDRKQK